MLLRRLPYGFRGSGYWVTTTVGYGISLRYSMISISASVRGSYMKCTAFALSAQHPPSYHSLSLDTTTLNPDPVGVLVIRNDQEHGVMYPARSFCR